MTETPQPPPDPGAYAEEDLHIVGERLPPPKPVHDPVVAVGALVTAAGGLVFGLGLLLGASRTVYGTGLAVGLLALAFSFHRYFTAEYPFLEAVEPRPRPEEDEAGYEQIPDPPRRSRLGLLLAAAAGLLGLSLAAPVASLGPTPGDALRRTRWRPGTRLVTGTGRPLRPGDIEPGGLVTAWPEHAIEHERSAVIVLRLSPRGPQQPTNLEWIVDQTLVAYSKICTHAGCPVGLFRERDDALFCPCHQATFDAARAAEPVFGPASRRLPQLPLGLDGDGSLVALGDFTETVGPAFGWLDRVRRERGA